MWSIGDNREKTCNGITRRGFLQVGFSSALGLSLPEILHARDLKKKQKTGQKEHSVMLIWLWGGPSHIDTFDMKPNAPLEYRGPFRPIGTNVPGIQVCEYLPLLAKQADKYAVLRSLYHGTNDHGLAGTIALTGKEIAGGRVMPSMGAVASRMKGYHPPLSSFVTVGGRMHQGHRPLQGEGGGILGTMYDPFRVEYDELTGVRIHDLTPPESLTKNRIERRKRFLHTIDSAQEQLFAKSSADTLGAMYEQAFNLLSSSAARAVFDMEKEPEAMRDRYGRYRFGQSCLLGRRLIESGVPFVQVNWSSHVESEEDWGDGGWDMHYRHFEITQERHMWMLDQSLSALFDDLDQRGLLATTTVVVMGEFGRMPKINEKAGRDHWNNCYSALIAGGGVRGGQVIGSSDAKAEFPASRPIKPADVCMTVYNQLGIPRTALLEKSIAPEGEVIEELF